jgi:hypothetical protein
MLRRQRLFRWAAQSTANTLSERPEVQRVAAFGAIAKPLKPEVPRFAQFRRHGIEILHECSDLDLAAWLTRFDQLSGLRKSTSRGLRLVQETQYGGVPHHQVDVHLLDSVSGEYRGRLCDFNSCPKHGKRECKVKNCGSVEFLRQLDRFQFNRRRFEDEPKVVLFDRSSGFLVRMPVIRALEAVRHRFMRDEDFLF